MENQYDSKGEEQCGPTWWRTFSFPVDDTNDDFDATHMFTLFEYFKRNADRYALLRVSCSDGTQAAYQRTFSNEALFPTGKTLIDALKGAENDMDTDSKTPNPSFIHVQKTGPPPTIRVSSNAFINPVLICVGIPISLSEFTTRVTRYFAHVQQTLQESQQDLREKKQTHKKAAVDLRKSIQEKVRFDKSLRLGTAVLMREKRKCPHRKIMKD